MRVWSSDWKNINNINKWQSYPHWRPQCSAALNPSVLQTQNTHMFRHPQVRCWDHKAWILFMYTNLHFQCWRAAEGTCCSSAGRGVCVRWAAGCGCWGRCWGGSTAVHRDYCLGWTLPCRSWREADPAGQPRRTQLVNITEKTTWNCSWGGKHQRELTQTLCLLIIRSMSSLILRYLSSDSGLWPAESSASMSGLSQPFKPFLRSVCSEEHKHNRKIKLNPHFQLYMLSFLWSNDYWLALELKQLVESSIS